VPDEEPGRVVPCERRDAGVPAQVGLERLLPGAEGVEQVQRQLAVVAFVVPLQQDQQRNGDLPGLVENDAGHETPGEKNGGLDAWLDQGQPYADADHASREPDRAADLGQRQEFLQQGLPFRDRLVDQREDQPVDDVVVRFAGLQRATQIGTGLLGGGTLAAVNVKASPEQQAAATKWIDFYYLGKFVRQDAAVQDAKTLADGDQPVGVPKLPIFDEATLTQYNEWIKPYVNVPLGQMSSFTEGIFGQNLAGEPPAQAQEMYAVLDTVVQAVLSDPAADVDALLAQADADVQTILDRS
jgi:hypothetical protein